MRSSAGLHEGVDNGTSGGRMVELECLHTSRGVIPDAPILYLIWGGQLEEKCLVKTWTSILAEICHPGSLQLNTGQQYSR